MNDNLLVGPNIHPELFDILIQFRSYKLPITADITKMYRQILVNDADRDYQLILWRSSKQDLIQILRLKTVTYGTSSASFLAVRCLKELAVTYSKEYPLASKAIKDNFYMDDLLVGASSETDLLELRSQITRLLGLGKFELHKWRSNVANFIDNPQDESLTISEERGIKTLGVFWNSYLDKFHFEFCNTDINKVIKRIVLSLRL